MHAYPLTFFEFLAAQKNFLLLQEILKHDLSQSMPDVIHRDILKSVGEISLLGACLASFNAGKIPKYARLCLEYHSSLITTFKHDFVKYSKRNQVKYLELLFKAVPQQLGEKFKYSQIDGDYRKRELAPAMDLLETAGLVHRVYSSSCQGFPLGAQAIP